MWSQTIVLLGNWTTRRASNIYDNIITHFQDGVALLLLTAAARVFGEAKAGAVAPPDPAQVAGNPLSGGKKKETKMEEQKTTY